MAKKPIEVKETNEVIKTNEVKKTKIKRLSKGLRKHLRRTKAIDRKEAIIVNPKNE
ncbi:MAG: hypothetical protein K0B14_05580 [Anaerolineaceae bacterium]|nr:hypothetical protein [Anaerolineaceae bacterium]